MVSESLWMETMRDEMGRAVMDELLSRGGFYTEAFHDFDGDLQREIYGALGSKALTALGLDDLDAAVERMGRAEYEDDPQRRRVGYDDYEAIPWDEIEEQYREVHRDTGRLLLSALLATEGPHDGR